MCWYELAHYCVHSVAKVLARGSLMALGVLRYDAQCPLACQRFVISSFWFSVAGVIAFH